MHNIHISKEVENAIKENKPVLALESTIISHGMPYPENVETALMLEKIARDNGVIPATIAIINGNIKVGLSKEEIEYIANKEVPVNKVSRRDLPISISRKENGATTVSATMYIAKLAGIKVFATGGIGGVHRHQEQARDISNDLEELSLDDVIVVCSGVKSILDIPNTLEYLETKGVPVLGYHTIKMPAFYTEDSGYKLEYMVEDSKEVASIAKTKWDLNISGSVLVVNPIPKIYSYDKEEIDKVINEALVDAKKEEIDGKRITPYLLQRIGELTNGKSLKANIELVKNNVYVASLIAKEMVK